MKVTLNENVVRQEIDEDFVGLALDASKCLWLSAKDGAVCFGYKDELYLANHPLCYDKVEWKDAIKHQGPFTKYNGSITLENS